MTNDAKDLRDAALKSGAELESMTELMIRYGLKKQAEELHQMKERIWEMQKAAQPRLAYASRRSA